MLSALSLAGTGTHALLMVVLRQMQHRQAGRASTLSWWPRTAPALHAWQNAAEQSGLQQAALLLQLHAAGLHAREAAEDRAEEGFICDDNEGQQAGRPFCRSTMDHGKF